VGFSLIFTLGLFSKGWIVFYSVHKQKDSHERSLFSKLGQRIRTSTADPELNRYLKISRAKAYYRIQRRTIPFIRLGRNVLLFYSEISGNIRKEKSPEMGDFL